MGDLVSPNTVIDGIREAAGRCWWGEIGLDDKNRKRLSVHYGDLIRSGHKWRKIRWIKDNSLRNELKMDDALKSDDDFLRNKLIAAINDLYGEKARDMAAEKLGDGSLGCRRVRKVVDDIRKDKECFRKKFFRPRQSNDEPPLPGTFEALLHELKKDITVPPKISETRYTDILKALANKIIDISGEDLSEARRFGEIRDNMREFFGQLWKLFSQARSSLDVNNPIIRQDLLTLFYDYLFDRSVILMVQPEGARGDLMMSIWAKYLEFFDINRPDSANISDAKSRKEKMTEFIFGKSNMPAAFEVTGSLRYRNPMDSLRSPDRGVHYTFALCKRVRRLPKEQFKMPKRQKSVDNSLTTQQIIESEELNRRQEDSLSPPTQQILDDLFDFKDFKDPEQVHSKEKISDMLHEQIIKVNSKVGDNSYKNETNQPKIPHMFSFPPPDSRLLPTPPTQQIEDENPNNSNNDKDGDWLSTKEANDLWDKLSTQQIEDENPNFNSNWDKLLRKIFL
jgi:hypothetical protein